MNERAEHQGIPVTVEGRRFHASGTYRHGKLPQTDTINREPADVLIGTRSDAPTAYLIPQGHGGHVVCLGFDSPSDAETAYAHAHPRPHKRGGMISMPVRELRDHLDRQDREHGPIRVRKGNVAFMRLSKSDYERRDPRTGKIEHVHDSRVKHVLTEQHPNGVYHYGIQREPGGHRVMMRIARPDGTASEWESAMMGGLQSEGEARKKLAQKMAAAHRQGSQVEHYDEDVKGHFDAALTEHRRREAADAKARTEGEARHQRENERRAQLDLDAGAAKFRKVKFRMHVIDGEPEDAEGWGIGGLVVHRVGEGRYAKYRVSHVGTGKTLGLEYDSQGQARMAAFRMSRETDWTQPASEIVKDKTLAGKIAALRVDPRGEFPEPEPERVKKSEPVFSDVGSLIKTLDLTRRPAQREPDDVVKSFEREHPRIAAIVNGRRTVTCDCHPGSGGTCSCSVTYGGATKPMKGVQTVKKSEIDGVSLKKSEGGEAIMKALRENPALRLVTLVTDGRFGLAPEHEDVQVLIHKRQTAERIEKALREREPGVSPTDLIQLDTGRVRAGLAPYLVRASAPTTTPGMLCKGDDALARAAAWLDAVAAAENGATR